MIPPWGGQGATPKAYGSGCLAGGGAPPPRPLRLVWAGNLAAPNSAPFSTLDDDDFDSGPGPAAQGGGLWSWGGQQQSGGNSWDGEWGTHGSWDGGSQRDDAMQPSKGLRFTGWPGSGCRVGGCGAGGKGCSPWGAEAKNGAVQPWAVEDGAKGSRQWAGESQGGARGSVSWGDEGWESGAKDSPSFGSQSKGGGLGGIAWPPGNEDESEPVVAGKLTGALKPGLQPPGFGATSCPRGIRGPAQPQLAKAPIVIRPQGCGGVRPPGIAGYGPDKWHPGSAASGPYRPPVATSGPFRPPPAYRPWGPTAIMPPTAASMQRAPLPVRMPNTVVLLGIGLQPGIEKDIEECVREIAIKGGFSMADEVRYVARTTCYIDFPHQDAAKEFMEKSGGNLKVGDRTFKMHLHGSEGMLQQQQQQQQLQLQQQHQQQQGQDEDNGPPQPTSSLLLRHIGDLLEVDIHMALTSFGQVKAVSIPLNFAGKPKNFARVDFNSISEASTTLSRLENAGCMVCGRKVTAVFAQPETDEDVARQNAARQAEDEMVKESAQQALKGINGSMWAEYMQLFKDGNLAISS